MKHLLVPALRIHCGEETCEGCHALENQTRQKPRCSIFDKTLVLSTGPEIEGILRCQECNDAETDYCESIDGPEDKIESDEEETGAMESDSHRIWKKLIAVLWLLGAPIAAVYLCTLLDLDPRYVINNNSLRNGGLFAYLAVMSAILREWGSLNMILSE